MKPTVNVLVLGVGGGVGQGIVKALRMSHIVMRIIGACVIPDAVGFAWCDAHYISPYANEEKFLEWFIGLCNREQIDIVFSGVEEILDVLAKDRSLIERNADASVIVASASQLAIARDKEKTVKWLHEYNFDYPRSLSADQAGLFPDIPSSLFPAILKPRHGKASQGIIRVVDMQDIKNTDCWNDYILQEYVGHSDQEYTVACYLDRQSSIRGTIVLHRELRYGSTIRCSVVEHEPLRLAAENIAHVLGAMGPINMQFRLRDEDKPVCFEINLRYSGTAPIRAHFGFNDVEAAVLEYAFDRAEDIDLRYRYGTAARYFEELYYDEG